MKDTIKTTMMSLLALSLLLATGCGDSESDNSGTPATAQLPAEMLLADPPAGAPKTITDLKANAKAGDRVTARVMIGGRKEPVVQGVAVMTVVDAALPNPCYRGDDHCATPWDYCCNEHAELVAHTATVRINDASGNPLAIDAAGAGLKPGSVMLVTATVAERANGGSLVLNADGIYLEPDQPKKH